MCAFSICKYKKEGNIQVLEIRDLIDFVYPSLFVYFIINREQVYGILHTTFSK